jgi:hypothetical protein
MTRRSFSVAGSVTVAGFAAGAGLFGSGRRFYALRRGVPSEPSLLLKAVAGPRLPETLALTPITASAREGVTALEAETDSFSLEKLRHGLLELRTYCSAAPGLASHLAAVFTRAGIRPLLRGTAGADLTYLIPFENLVARDRAWTALNADPQWISTRHKFHSYHFGLYRVV